VANLFRKQCKKISPESPEFYGKYY